MIAGYNVSAAPSTRLLKTVAVVSNQPPVDVLETILDGGDYDVVRIESIDQAYTHIKRVSPELVILCLDGDGAAGCQVLSMLKLDAATARIPVITHLSTGGGRRFIHDGNAELGDEAIASVFA